MDPEWVKFCHWVHCLKSQIGSDIFRLLIPTLFDEYFVKATQHPDYSSRFSYYRLRVNRYWLLACYYGYAEALKDKYEICVPEELYHIAGTYLAKRYPKLLNKINPRYNQDIMITYPPSIKYLYPRLTYHEQILAALLQNNTKQAIIMIDDLKFVKQFDCGKLFTVAAKQHQLEVLNLLQDRVTLITDSLYYAPFIRTCDASRLILDTIEKDDVKVFNVLCPKDAWDDNIAEVAYDLAKKNAVNIVRYLVEERGWKEWSLLLPRAVQYPGPVLEYLGTLPKPTNFSLLVKGYSSEFELKLDDIKKLAGFFTS